MTTGKTTAFIQTFVDKVKSLLFNMLSRFVTTFLPRSKSLLILWLQSPSAVENSVQENNVCHCWIKVSLVNEKLFWLRSWTEPNHEPKNQCSILILDVFLNYYHRRFGCVQVSALWECFEARGHSQLSSGPSHLSLLLFMMSEGLPELLESDSCDLSSFKEKFWSVDGTLWSDSIWPWENSPKWSGVNG